MKNIIESILNRVNDTSELSESLYIKKKYYSSMKEILTYGQMVPFIPKEIY